MKGQTDEELRTLFSESEVGRILLPRGFVRWYTSHAHEVSNALVKMITAGSQNRALSLCGKTTSAST